MANDVLQMPSHVPSPVVALNGSSLPPPVQPPNVKGGLEADAQILVSDRLRVSRNPTPEEGMTSGSGSATDAGALPHTSIDSSSHKPVDPSGNTKGPSQGVDHESNRHEERLPSPAFESVKQDAASEVSPSLPPSLAKPQATEESQNTSVESRTSHVATQQTPAASSLPSQHDGQAVEQASTPDNGSSRAQTPGQGAETASTREDDRTADVASRPLRRNLPIAPAATRTVTRSPPISFPIAGSAPVQNHDQRQPGRPGFEHPVCSNCGTTKTPLWRRGPAGQNLCNACGLYIKARNINRPTTLKRSPVTRMVPLQSIMGSCPGDGRCNGTGGSESCPQCPSFNNTRMLQTQNSGDGPASVNMVSCQNCGTVTTPLWRRDAQGHIICNACGLYNRLHKNSRPQILRASVIKRRRRNTIGSSDSGDEFAEANRTDAQQTGSPAAKLSQPPSPGTDSQQSHVHGPQGPDGLCCEHVSPAIQQPQQQLAPPAYAPQIPQGNQGTTALYNVQQGPPPGPPQHQKSGAVPYGYYPMSHGAPMGLSMMLPPPGPGYMGQQPWHMHPQMGSQYPYPPPPPMAMPAHSLPSAPPAFLPPRQSNSPQVPPPHDNAPSFPQASATPQQPMARSSVSPQSTPAAQEAPQLSQQQLRSPPVTGLTKEQQEQPHQQSVRMAPASQPVTPAGHAASEATDSATSAANPAKERHEPEARDSRDSVTLTRIHELQRTTSTGALDSSDSPLAVLQYLKGASQDTISEYLLAAQRQLNDKVNQLRRGLGRAELQLKECEDALKEINKSGPK